MKEQVCRDNSRQRNFFCFSHSLWNGYNQTAEAWHRFEKHAEEDRMMLHRGLAIVGMAAALAAFLWAGASQGSDTMPLTLKGGTASTGFSGGADIMTLKLDQGADTVAVRG